MYFFLKVLKINPVFQIFLFKKLFEMHSLKDYGFMDFL